jgi:hypothetical protein
MSEDYNLETLLKVLDTEVREVSTLKGSVYLTLKEYGKDKNGRNNTNAFMNGPLAMAKIGDSLIVSVAINEEEYIVVILHPYNIDLKIVPKEK